MENPTETVEQIDSIDEVGGEDGDEAEDKTPVVTPQKAALIEDIMNVFTVYHQQWYNQEKATNMFTGVDYSKKNSTTLMMESLYNEMHKYKEAESNPRLITIYDPDDMSMEEKSRLDEMYLLDIDSVATKFSPRLFPLVSYVATLDWRNLRWRITPIRRDFG